MTSYAAEVGQRLLSALTELCNAAIVEDVPKEVMRVYNGASLIAIRNKKKTAASTSSQ